ncbi:hypothetical protein QBC35DRAFT_70498 [Podospora australis]|uniref:Uncharacterized protein n=1 Tax=Podospora australis TaxID=1536484 RepID=A0AAN6X2Z6_9PEZI|nr:hypothetical protein QBC35DRAFT_70498 [Podospora australis]
MYTNGIEYVLLLGFWVGILSFSGSGGMEVSGMAGQGQDRTMSFFLFRDYFVVLFLFYYLIPPAKRDRLVLFPLFCARLAFELEYLFSSSFLFIRISSVPLSFVSLSRLLVISCHWGRTRTHKQQIAFAGWEGFGWDTYLVFLFFAHIPQAWEEEEEEEEGGFLLFSRWVPHHHIIIIIIIIVVVIISVLCFTLLFAS